MGNLSFYASVHPPAAAKDCGHGTGIGVGVTNPLLDVADEISGDDQSVREARYRAQQAEIARVCRINTVGEMVSSLAHELGQPLSSMQNYAHGCLLRLAAKELDVDALKHALIQVIRNAEHAGQIVRRVRSYLSKHNPERTLQALSPILDDVVQFLEPEAARLGVRLRLRENLPGVKAVIDRIELEQVVINLVKNSFDAVADMPAIQRVVDLAFVQRGPQHVVIAVADSGPGIPEVIRESVFDPFFTTKPDGIGLGLAICRSIVEANGGNIIYKPSWLGGALFEILLPIEVA